VEEGVAAEDVRANLVAHVVRGVAWEMESDGGEGRRDGEDFVVGEEVVEDDGLIV